MGGFIIQICIDSREKKRAYQAVKYYTKKGYDSKIKALEYGDYVFYDDSNDKSVVFEYKTIEDMMSSILDSSVFHETVNQALNYPFHYLIIVGNIENYYASLLKIGLSPNRENIIKRFRGAIRRIRTYTNVIMCRNTVEALEEMLEQSKKCLNFKGYGGVVRPSKWYNVNPCKSPLMELKGVGDKISDRIIEEFGLDCLNDLSNIHYDDLLSVSGVNESMCDNFWLKVYGYVPEKDSKENEKKKKE